MAHAKCELVANRSGGLMARRIGRVKRGTCNPWLPVLCCQPHNSRTMAPPTLGSAVAGVDRRSAGTSAVAGVPPPVVGTSCDSFFHNWSSKGRL
eukprot:4493093-Pyramimonas_sp.AAC.1